MMAVKVGRNMLQSIRWICDTQSAVTLGPSSQYKFDRHSAMTVPKLVTLCRQLHASGRSETSSGKQQNKLCLLTKMRGQALKTLMSVLDTNWALHCFSLQDRYMKAAHNLLKLYCRDYPTFDPCQHQTVYHVGFLISHLNYCQSWHACFWKCAPPPLSVISCMSSYQFWRNGYVAFSNGV
jgi:hypothetical protein